MGKSSKADILRKLPPGLIDALLGQYSQSEFEEILRGFGTERNPILRMNPLVQDPKKTEAHLREKHFVLQKLPELPYAFEVTNASEKALIESEEGKKGAFLLQGFSSQVPVLFLRPQAGEKIWDMCAAPGSKTSQIAAMTMKNAEILASEIDQIRFEKLRNTLRIQKADDSVHTWHESAVPLSKKYPEYFDAILLDAPCSAEGRINLSEPASYRFWSEKNRTAHAKLQRQLFRAAVAALKPGGRMVYSTCTLASQENEEIVEWALQEFSSTIRFVPLKSTGSLIRERKGMLFILPGQKAEGFFLASFRKVSTS